jgi:hypothetical protein
MQQQHRDTVSLQQCDRSNTDYKLCNVWQHSVSLAFVHYLAMQAAELRQLLVECCRSALMCRALHPTCRSFTSQ